MIIYGDKVCLSFFTFKLHNVSFSIWHQKDNMNDNMESLLTRKKFNIFHEMKSFLNRNIKNKIHRYPT